MLIKFNDGLLSKVSKKRPFIYWISKIKFKTGDVFEYYFAFEGQNNDNEIQVKKDVFYSIIKEIKASGTKLYEKKFGKQIIGFNFHDDIEFKIYSTKNNNEYILEYYDLFKNYFPMNIDDFYNQVKLEEKINNFD